jgi:Mn-dependent DtxR family transcriptional regulator
MKTVKVGNQTTQNSVIELLSKTKIPVDVEFVARQLGVGWGTARAILMDLALQGKVHMEKTTKSWVFTLNTKQEVPAQ